MSVERRNESGANNFSTVAELIYGIFFSILHLHNQKKCAYDIHVYVDFDKFNYRMLCSYKQVLKANKRWLLEK